MRSKFKIPVAITIIFLTLVIPSHGQECTGSELKTKESYLYGRFEVEMQSAEGNGIVSSFFLFNKETNCNWPAENNEIDIEMTGDDHLIYFTTHHPDPEQAWFYGEDFDLGFNPHQTMQNYAIEWEPGIVRWFVDDELIYVQNESATEDLMYPMAIFMNLWVSEAVDWVGPWDPSVLPKMTQYEYVRYYEYAPSTGNTGTENRFKLVWEDDFETLDTSRWAISDFSRLGEYCTFRETNVGVAQGLLTLNLTGPFPQADEVPVAFSVDMREQNLSSTDVVYLHGNFNNWCGTCDAMVENNGIWELILDLPPERYEYVFSINDYSETGTIPIGSDCDFNPCDEFGNYGIYIKEGSAALTIDTHCWQNCATCVTSSTNEIDDKLPRTLMKIFDIQGRVVKEEIGRLLFYLYDDGTVEKNIIIE
jgi:hypothetical protein